MHEQLFLQSMNVVQLSAERVDLFAQVVELLLPTLLNSIMERQDCGDILPLFLGRQSAAFHIIVKLIAKEVDDFRTG